MYVIYLVTTIAATLANGYAACLDFAGAESVKAVADRLVAGFAVPALGTAAAIGLVLYFVCAVTAHVRVHDRQIGGAVFFLLLAAAALATALAYRDG